MRWLVLVLVVACGGRPHAPAAPAPTVKNEVELAERAEKQRRHDIARVHYEKAIAIAGDPASNAFARREFAETLASWGELGEAVTQLEASVKLVDDAGAWHNLGMLRHKLGDVPGAIAALEKARALQPESYEPRRSLAVIRWLARDYAGARAEYQGMLDLDLPPGLRDKVNWAIRELSAQLAKP